MIGGSKRLASVIILPFIIAIIVALTILLIYAIYTVYAVCNNEQTLGFVAWFDGLFSDMNKTNTSEKFLPGYYITHEIGYPTKNGIVTGGNTITTNGFTTGGTTTHSGFYKTTTGYSTTVGGQTVGSIIEKYEFVDPKVTVPTQLALVGAVLYNAAVNGGVITDGSRTGGTGAQSTGNSFRTYAIFLGETITDGTVRVDLNATGNFSGTVYGGRQHGGVFAKFMANAPMGSKLKKIWKYGQPFYPTSKGNISDTVLVVDGTTVGGITTGCVIYGCTVTGTTVTGGIATEGTTVGGTTTGGHASASNITGFVPDQSADTEDYSKFILCGAVLIGAVITGGTTTGGTTTGGVVSGGKISGTPNADGVITNATITGATITGGTTVYGTTMVNVNAALATKETLGRSSTVAL